MPCFLWLINWGISAEKKAVPETQEVVDMEEEEDEEKWING